MFSRSIVDILINFNLSIAKLSKSVKYHKSQNIDRLKSEFWKKDPKKTNVLYSICALSDW